MTSTGRIRRYQRGAGGFSDFKALFIADPDRAESDVAEIAQTRRFATDQQLVQELLAKEPGMLDRIVEIFSTHPNVTKRLMALQELEVTLP